VGGGGVWGGGGGGGGGCDYDDGLKKRRVGKSRRRRNTADALKCRKAETRMESQRTSLPVLRFSAFYDYATKI
jgi:hypothetical protein